MALNIGICDDDNVHIEYLIKLVKLWGNNSNTITEIDFFYSAESFLFHYEEDKRYDILLLDIEMEEMNGVSLAKKIRENNKSVQIIFITGYLDYILEGYEVAALHYLIKPVNKEKLFEVLNRAIEKLEINEKTLLVEALNETIKLPLYEIKYFEVIKNYVTIHANKKYIVKRTLSDIAKELDNRFVRSGRSYIVNLNYINRVSKTEIHILDGTTIPLPRGMYEIVNRAIIERL